MPDQEPFNPEQFSKLVADTSAQIRQQDVYRLFDECAQADRPVLLGWLVTQRPDLADEAQQIMSEL